MEAFTAADAARARAWEIGALLAGEREAHRIAGFDLGNSPLEFTRERVAARVICATTTNGTRALLAAREVPHVFVAGLVNLAATAASVRELLGGERDLRHVHIICAGSEGQPSAEDSLCADWLAAAIRGRSLPETTTALVALGTSAPHANTLRAAGYAEDVAFALRLDVLPIAAALRDGRIVAV